MPKVIIWRDDAVETEFDPAHRDWRIGRSETNDIALLDPRKSVSRFHAELREENGAWYFIDLNSQNGSWRDGQRVTRLLLEHDVEVSFGDYRLGFVDRQNVPAAAVPLSAADTAAASAAAPAVPVNPDQTLMMPSAKKEEPVASAAPGTPAVRAKRPATAPKKGINPVILILFVLAMVGAVAAIGWRVYQSMSDPVSSSQPAQQAPAAPPAPAPDPAAVAAAKAAAEEEAAREAKAKEEAEAAEAAAAKEEAARAAAAARPRPPRRPAPPPPPRIPPEVEEQYEAGRRALTAQRFGEAVRQFEGVLSAMPGFRDTESLLAQARTSQRDAQAQALVDGRRLESAGEWRAAVTAYERAGAASELAAARTKMHEAGDDAYRKARQFDARGRPAEAIGWYERAMDWLAPQDARRDTARARLVELKGGDE